MKIARDGAHAPTRRHFFRTAARSVGLLGAATVAAGIAEADGGDDGRRPLYVETLGEARGATGATLAFIPGLGATTRYWRDRVAPLARSHRLVLVDPLGFGRSPKPWTAYTVDRHLSALERVLGPVAAERGRLTLVGHSAGARLAVAYAARHPEQVGRLVLVSLPYFGGPGRATRYFREERGGEGWVMTHPIPAAVMCLVSRRLTGWLLPHVIRDMPREVVEDLTRMTWRSATSTLWEVIYRYDLAADLARLPARLALWCLHGDADPSAPPGPVRALAATHPNCTLRVRPGGDHHLLLHATAWTLARLRDAVASGAPGPLVGATTAPPA